MNYEMKDEVITSTELCRTKFIERPKKSICKIIIKDKEKNEFESSGTGFFLRFPNSLKSLITNYHVLNPTIFQKIIEIEIYNQKKMILNVNNRYIKYFDKPKDVTVIEIKDYDDIYNDIEFSYCDNNYSQNGYYIYKDVDVFSIEHPLGKDSHFGYGKIIYINGYEFYHNIPTQSGSSGSPIILLNNNINIIQVVGIHKKGNKQLGLNLGTFIGEIINEINNDITNKITKEKNTQRFEDNKDEKDENSNYIIAEIYITDNEVNKNIRILNSYEEYKRNKYFNKNLELNLVNEEYIKECDIMINGELIPFNYFHCFEKKGVYIIKYIFRKNLSRINNMFYDCEYIRSINLSNLKTEKVTNIKEMFCNCYSLETIDLSSFQTKNVKDMSYMFYGCSSLININLSSFDTQNVTDMSSMFSGCYNLTSINNINFNTKNVTNMSSMFYKCQSLSSLDLSKFNTDKVIDMSYMFMGCKSLPVLDLSNFDTKNVTNMKFMFFGCSSLVCLNILNFSSQSIIDMNYIFYKCLSLCREKLIAKEVKFYQELSKIFIQKLDDCNIF